MGNSEDCRRLLSFIDFTKEYRDFGNPRDLGEYYLFITFVLGVCNFDSEG